MSLINKSSVLKIREISERFVLQNQNKKNSTQHQLLEIFLQQPHLWVSALYKTNSKNDLECYIHTLIFEEGRIILFTEGV